MEQVYLQLANSGALGALVVVLVVWVRHLQDRLLAVVENNTKALAEVKSTLEKCQLVHDREGGR